MPGQPFNGTLALKPRIARKGSSDSGALGGGGSCTRTRRLALLNVKYSPNLGDGVIAECLEQEISRQYPDHEVTSIDLAGRDFYGSGLDAGRGTLLRMLSILPSGLRKLAARTTLKLLIRFKYRPFWRQKLNDVSAAIIGGGQLLADSDLNFPLKINAMTIEIARRSASLAIFGVGVAETMTPEGSSLFRKALQAAPIKHVAVRDKASQSNWEKLRAGTAIPPAELCHDPGLLASDTYRVNRARGVGGAAVVGIGIISPQTLKLHSNEDRYTSKTSLFRFWTELARDLAARGHQVGLFTNGPHDDEALIDEILAEVDEAGIERMPRPVRPRELSETIAHFDAVVAHRLHANILAYSYQIPHVGLSWDPKLDAFFGSVERGGFIADPMVTMPNQVADLVDEAIEAGIDSRKHQQILEQARNAIGECIQDLLVSSEIRSC